MGNLAFVIERLRHGDRVRFFQDFYGRQWIELSRGWLLERKIRIALSDEQILQLKTILRQRKRAMAGE
jgi:hypothetical protein